MKEKLRNILLALCELLIGILLLIDPVNFTAGILIAVGVALCLLGIVSIIGYFRSEPMEGAIRRQLSKGILELLGGLFCVCNPNWFLASFPVLTALYGVGTLISGVLKVELTVDLLRAKRPRWGWAAAGTVITLVCAGVILFNPFATTVVLWTFIAVSLMAEAVLDLISALFPGKREEDAI